MSALKSLGMFGLHLVLAIVVLPPVATVLIVMLTFVPDLLDYDGAATLIGLALVVALLVLGGLVAGTVTAAIAFIVGLPIRLIPAAHRWWVANGEIAFVGIVVGAVLIVLAWPLGTLERGALDGIEFRQWVPNLWLLLVGWLLFAFCLTHVWWPGRWRPRRRFGAASTELLRS